MPAKVMSSLFVLSNTRADFLNLPWTFLQNLPELTKCPVALVFMGVKTILDIGGLVFRVHSNGSKSHTE